MGILEESGQHASITSGWRALDLFVDRLSLVRAFAEHLHADPTPQRILYLSGDGGNGKSLLMRYLATRCAKVLEPENWEWLRTLDDADLVANLETAERAVPAVTHIHDFGLAPSGEDRPLEALSALLMTRRALAPAGAVFPLFDYGVIRYLESTGTLSTARLDALIPGPDREMFEEIAGVVAMVLPPAAILKEALKHLRKRLGTRVDRYRHRRRLEVEAFADVQRLDPATELRDELPSLLAHDLNAWMGIEGAPARLVLFFDTHEAFWRERRDLSSDLFFWQDEWLRRLLGTLDLTAGIVCVVAGREAPRWHEAPAVRIPERYIDVRPVGPLAPGDAAAYLTAAGVADAGTRSALIDAARSAPDEIHPFYLGLCADVALAAARRGEPLDVRDLAGSDALRDGGAMLLGRLTRYTTPEMAHAIKALAACRAFDRETFRFLGERLAFHASDPGFDDLVRLSFVWQADGGYRLHGLLRRLLREQGEPTLARAHAAMEEWYRSRPDTPSARCEAIYHAAAHAPDRGLSEWTEAFEAASRGGDHDTCRALLEVSTEVVPERGPGAARAWLATGAFLLTVSRHAEAEDAFAVTLGAAGDDAEPGRIRGLAHAGIGDVLAVTGRDEDALVRFDEALRHLEPSGSPADRSDVLRRSGEVLTRLARHAEALARLRDAAGACDGVAGAEPVLGRALLRLGEALAATARHDEATDALSRAVTALERAPATVATLSNLGGAHLRLGELHASRSEPAAERSFAAAVAIFDDLTSRSPGYVLAYNNGGLAAQALGAYLMASGRRDDGARWLGEALVRFDEALRRAPGYVFAHNNRGIVLQALGDARATEGTPEAAEGFYRASIAAYDVALQIAPGDVSMLNNRGNALLALGEHLAAQSAHAVAQTVLTDAVHAFDRAIARAPRYVAALANRALALAATAASLSASGAPGPAADRYDEATSAFNAALEVAPDDVETLRDLGRMLADEADLLERGGDAAAAADRRASAADALRRAVALAPADGAARALLERVSR